MPYELEILDEDGTDTVTVHDESLMEWVECMLIPPTILLSVRYVPNKGGD